ncbi:anti-sigma factor domain-containing protein [Terriglobus sp.]|uniref:anti-sigma factor domain-containing protein n=1 Tax=Terriglobus sp. TaxID=1889013 RepID=UPI003B00C5D2
MIEPTITAEDLTLYALELLEGDEQAHVDAMLRKSTAAREELAAIRGDLALFGLATEQHTPPALTRQRLLKQVARERRTVPVEVPVQDDGAPAVPQSFAADHGHSNDAPFRTPERAVADFIADPLAQAPGGVPKTVQTRAFPSRSQQARTAAAPLSVQRAVPEPKPMEPEPASAAFSADAASFAGDPARFATERQTFSPDPQVFPREARAMATSATAHSVTMFEQHFAADSTQRGRVPELPPDLEAYSGRRGNEPADAVADVQDKFVPSNTGREESFAFSSYRDREVREVEDSNRGAFGRWLGWSGWAVAAAVAVAAVFAWRDDFSLREQVSRQQSLATSAEISSARAETVMQTLQSPSSQHFLLERTDAAPAPGGRVVYLPERGTLIFQGSNLETLQPYKTYELWLIPAGEGRQPMPAGLFKPDGHGYATVVLPQMQKGVIAANFGVTIEDEGGSATPTLPILLVGQQS